jgi:subtilisin family serine protease
MTTMQKRKSGSPITLRLLIWAALGFLAILNVHGHGVSARQDAMSPEPTLESTETPLPEETTPPITDTPMETPTIESATPEAEIPQETPSAIPSVVPESSATPQVDEQKAAPLSTDDAPEEILIRFRKTASEEDAAQCLSAAGAEFVSIIEELNVWVVRVPEGKSAEAIAILSSCQQVRYAEPNYMASVADTIPTDANWNRQYGLVNIRAPQGWDYSTGSAAVTIAIVDTGVDLDHPDLLAKIVPGRDVINDDDLPDDDHFQSHGTHVAGIAAAASNNGLGVTGVSWGARIMPVKVLGPFGIGPLSGVAEGIVWATNHGAQVINLSLGSDSDSLALQDAVNYAYQRGVILVAASGNDPAGAMFYPALYPNVVAVGAVDATNVRLPNSSYGANLDLVAPGFFIYSTLRNGYGYNSGTSMAAPFVSGLAAVLYGMPGNGSSAAVISQMQASAKDLDTAGFDYEYGFGLIQMDSALKLVAPVAPATAPATATKSPGGMMFYNPGAPTFAVSPTQTTSPSPTATSTLTPLPVTASPSHTPTSTVQPSPTEEEPQARALEIPSWQLPCAGAAFIAAGALLIWVSRKKQRR